MYIHFSHPCFTFSGSEHGNANSMPFPFPGKCCKHTKLNSESCEQKSQHNDYQEILHRAEYTVQH